MAKYFRCIARYTLLSVLTLVMIFAMLSGSGDYGGGIKGIMHNSMNASPWLLLLVILFIAWKWELIGGLLITGLGMYAMCFFNFPWKGFDRFPFFLCLSIVLFGSFYLISWNLRRKANKQPLDIK